MNGKSIWYTTQHILRDREIELSLEQWNRYYQLTNEELKNTVYGRVGEPEGFETERQISDDLLPFKTTSSAIVVTAGSATLPTDYWHKVYMEVASTGVEIEILESREFSRRKNNAATGASADYPICEIKDGTFSVLPTSITSVNFTYLKKGNTPAVVLEDSNGVQIYSSSSVEPEWNDDKYMDFIRIFVGLLSVPMTPEQLLQYTEAKVDKEN